MCLHVRWASIVFCRSRAMGALFDARDASLLLPSLPHRWTFVSPTPMLCSWIQAGACVFVPGAFHSNFVWGLDAPARGEASLCSSSFPCCPLPTAHSGEFICDLRMCPRLRNFLFPPTWFVQVHRNGGRYFCVLSSAGRHLGSSRGYCCRARAMRQPQRDGIPPATIRRPVVCPCLQFERINLAGGGMKFAYAHEFTLQPPILSHACLQVC